MLLLCFTVFIDMVNGFFLMQDIHLPISQLYKLILLALMAFRVFFTKDFLFFLVLLIAFQIAPLVGWIKTGNFATYIEDMVLATKWLTIPLSFFYFKGVFQASYFSKIYNWLKYTVYFALFFLFINLLLGALGFGMSFYFHGYGNAVGTRGFIYAGNELTILVLTIGFLVAVYLKQIKRYFLFAIGFLLFVIFAFLITSKTVLGGVLIVFLIPWVSTLSRKISTKWLKLAFLIALLAIPLLIGVFYYGIKKSGVVEKLKTSREMNDGDFLQTLLSNRNNFLIDGWQAFSNNYNVFEKVFGLGQSYYVNLVDSIPELDFFTLLFTNGYFGLLALLLLIFYWFLNAKHLSQNKDNIYANSVILFLFFITISSNLAGHIYSSAIAGFYIGLSLAIMFMNKKKLS